MLLKRNITCGRANPLPLICLKADFPNQDRCLRVRGYLRVTY